MTGSRFIRLLLLAAAWAAPTGIAQTTAQQPKTTEQKPTQPKTTQPKTTEQKSAQQKGAPAAQPLRSGFNLPPAGETRFLPAEMLLDIPADVPTPTLDAIASRHTMTRLQTQTFGRTRRTFRPC